MTFQPGHEPTHKGRTTATAPLRGAHLKAIRHLLRFRPRDLALWSVGTNSALRGGDLVSLTWDDAEDDGEAITLRVKERKTGKVRLVTLNPVASADLRAWRALSNSPFVFSGQRGKLTVATLGRLVKSWAKEVGVEKHIASHSLRKSFSRSRYDQGVSLATLMHILNHGSERTTLLYIGLTQEDERRAYDLVT